MLECTGGTMKYRTKNYFLILAGMLIILIMAILLYGNFFQKQKTTLKENEEEEQNTSLPSKAIGVQLVEPNGEEKVSNIPMEFMQAGNFAQETETIQ